MRPKTVEQKLAFWEARLAKPCFVYVIHGDDFGPIKVGKAKDVPARMRGLQTGNPQKLELLEVLPGGGDLEVHLHAKLDPWRITGTEWFRRGTGIDKALAYIHALSERMVAGYSKFGEAPHFTEADPVKFGRVRKKRDPAPVVVRFTDPNPTVPPDEAQRMRESVRGCSRSAYLGPASGSARQRISPSRGFGN